MKIIRAIYIILFCILLVKNDLYCTKIQKYSMDREVTGGVYQDLRKAIEYGNIQGVKELLFQQTVVHEKFINQGLLLAAEMKKVDILTYFLNKGAQVNFQGSGWTALHYAVRRDYGFYLWGRNDDGSYECVEKLLRAGANINALTWWSQKSPLFVAIEWRDFDMVKLLVNAGARLDIQSYWSKNSVLHAAIEAKDVKILAYLVEAGASLCARDKWGRTPYMLAEEYAFTSGRRYYDNMKTFLLVA